MSEVIYDSILGKLREAEVGGGTGGGGGTSYVFDGDQFTVSGDSVSITGTVPSAKVASGVDASAVDYRLTVTSGAASFNPIANIVNATGATVTLAPDTAYKVQATTSAVTLNANTPASGQWGLEGHIELFVAGTGYVVTGSNVVLANALEPDAVNNCTVRFHDGLAIISVEDHVAGYIVTVNSASGAGSLAYGLATATNEYISVDASLNGQTLDLAGATTYAGEKHIVGNGYTETIISGGITCTSKTTFSNLGMDGVIVSSGTLTLGDVFVPSGATVEGSGGRLAVEKVVSDNSVVSSCQAVSISGATLTQSSGASDIVYLPQYASGAVINCMSGLSMVAHTEARTVTLKDCTVTTQSIVFFVANRATTSIGTMILDGTNKFNKVLSYGTADAKPYVKLLDGSTVDFAGVSGATLINCTPGLITVGSDCSVIISNGTTVSLTGGTYHTLASDGTLA